MPLLPPTHPPSVVVCHQGFPGRHPITNASTPPTHLHPCSVIWGILADAFIFHDVPEPLRWVQEEGCVFGIRCTLSWAWMAARAAAQEAEWLSPASGCCVRTMHASPPSPIHSKPSAAVWCPWASLLLPPVISSPTPVHHIRPFPSFALCSLVGAGIICCSSFFVAFSQKKASAHKTAGQRWEASTLRLTQEGALSEEEQQQRAALLCSRSSSGFSLADSEGEEEALPAAAAAAAGGSASSLEDWASAREAASRAGSGVGWWEGGSDDGSGGGTSSLEAELKEAVVAAAAAADVAQPDTPAAPPPLPTPQHGSIESLPPLGGSPGGNSVGASAGVKPWGPS